MTNSKLLSKFSEGSMFFMVITFALLLTFCIFYVVSCQEAKAYTSLTGVEVTTWDAMWVQLRVVEPYRVEPEDD